MRWTILMNESKKALAICYGPATLINFYTMLDFNMWTMMLYKKIN